MSCQRKLKSKGNYCSKCQRLKNPYKYAYQTLKDNAKRRGKEFSLTFEQFREFAVETDYITRKGIRKNSIHIDRKNEKLGYTIDNIQPLTNSENVRKYLKYYWDEYNKKMNFEFKTYIDGKKEECSREGCGHNDSPF